MTGGMDQSDLDYEPPRLSWFQRFKEYFRFYSFGPVHIETYDEIMQRVCGKPPKSDEWPWPARIQVGWLTAKGKLISLDQCTLSSEQMTAAGAQRVFVEKP